MVSRFVMASMGVHLLAAVGLGGVHRVQTKNSPIVVEITPRKIMEVKMPDVVPVPPPPVEAPKPLDTPPEPDKAVPAPEADLPQPTDPAVQPTAAVPQVQHPVDNARNPRPIDSHGQYTNYGAGSGDSAEGGHAPGAGTITGMGGTGGTSGTGSLGLTGAGTDSPTLIPGSAGHAAIQNALAGLFGASSGGTGSAGAGGGGGAPGARGRPLVAPGTKTPTTPTPPPTNTEPSMEIKDLQKCNGEDAPLVNVMATAEHCGQCGRLCTGKKTCVLGQCIGGDSFQFRLKEVFLHPSDEIGWPTADGTRQHAFLDFLKGLKSQAGGDFDWEENIRNVIEKGWSNTLINVPPFESATDPVNVMVGETPTKVNKGMQSTTMMGGQLTPAGFTWQAVSGNNPPTLFFQVVQNGATLTLPIAVDYMHLDFDPTNGKPTGLCGDLRGAVRVTKLLDNSKFINELASYLDKQAHDPGNPYGKSILSVIDDFGAKPTCTNPDGSVAHLSDGKIDACEVMGKKSLFDPFLRKDKRLWNAAGSYNNTLNQSDITQYDSMTFGIKFCAVSNSFGG